jgi:hypothetical protein
MAKFWQDPRALAINRRQIHTPLKSYVAPDAAARQLALPTQGYAPAGSREQLLSGCDWRFKLFDSPEDVPASFSKRAFEEDGFTRVSSSSMKNKKCMLWYVLRCRSQDCDCNSNGRCSTAAATFTQEQK